MGSAELKRTQEFVSMKTTCPFSFSTSVKKGISKVQDDGCWQETGQAYRSSMPDETDKDKERWD
eukprot:751357-Hanusia_phi.AAC.2